MKILVDGKVIDGVVRDGRVEVTFTKQDKSPISIGALEDCAGTTVIDNIQLEQADKATAYEDPALIQGEATGLIKDIRGLEYAINDPVNGLRSQLTILAQGFEAEVADAIGNYSVQGQTIDGLFSEIKSIDGNLNQLVRNAEGNNQLISSIQNDVAQNRLDYHSLKETADSYERIIGSSQGEFENNVSRAVQTSGLIQQEVASLTSGLSTTVSQLEDSWAMQLKDGNDVKAALNATTDGIRLKGDLIYLDGDTYMSEAFADKIKAIEITADKIVGGTADFAKIRAVNLDVNSLSGNTSQFVQSIWNGLNNSIRIDTDGIRSTAINGDWTLYHAGAISFGNNLSQGIYLEYADGTRNGLAINNRGALNTEITLDLMSSARNTMNFGRRTDTNGYDFRIDHYQGSRVSFDGRGVSRYTFNVNSDAQSHAISILGHGAKSGYNDGSGISIGLETADGVTKGSRFYFSSASDLVWLGKDSFSDLKPLAVFDLQFRWGQSERKSLKDVLEYLSRAAGVDINNIPSV